MENGPASLASRLGSVYAGLRTDLEVSRHTFRGEASYVVRNPTTFQSHHFSTDDYRVLVSLSDEKPLAQVFAELVESNGLGRDQEEDFYGFILSLHQFGLLDLPVSNGKDLYARFRKRKAMQRRSQFTGFLFLRVPLVNPNALLERTAAFVAPLFSRAAFVIWLLMLAASGAILFQRWNEFVGPLQSILVAQNLVGLWVLLIALKVIHEFGHAYACKRFGGNVPEMGAFLICFTPCAYVDASAAWGFNKRYQRIVVSLAGIYVESIVACIALLIWHVTGPSEVNSYAHQVVTLASVVTIGFNINPLMKFDGYFVLSDLVEIPNLRDEASEQLNRVLKRVFLGIRSKPLSHPFSVRCLLTVYGLAAACWKVALTLGICAAISFKIHFWGILLAGVFGAGVLWNAVSRLCRYLWSSPETDAVRWRAAMVSGFAFLGAPICLTTLPITTPTEIPGVVLSQDEAVVCARSAGFVTDVHTGPGETLRAGDVLCSLDNPELRHEAERLSAELRLLNLKADSEFAERPIASTLPRIEAAHLDKKLAFTRQRIADLQVRSPTDGTLVRFESIEQLGSFVKKGQPVATIASNTWNVRAYARDEALSDWTPEPGQRLQVRLSGDLSEQVEGVVTAASLRGVCEVRDVSLTQLGGGDIPVAEETLATDDPYFEITIRLSVDDQQFIKDGMTAIVSCPAESRPLGTYLHRLVIRFLNRLRS
jgi:putative peptide zinc metalloprotease protein